MTNSYANPQSFSFSWQQYEGQPVIDNMLGLVYEPGVRVEGTCSLLYNGTMYILGGPPNSQDATQLLKVNKCTVQFRVSIENKSTSYGVNLSLMFFRGFIPEVTDNSGTIPLILLFHKK